jgi:hypothetical protein
VKGRATTVDGRGESSTIHPQVGVWIGSSADRGRIFLRQCALCSRPFPAKIKVGGRWRSLQNRHYCLTCSPYKAHNTRLLTEPLTAETRQQRTTEVRRAKFRTYQRKTRRYRKRLLVRLLGGCCQICGYDRDCPAAYAFHHRDPASKVFDVSTRGLLRRWDELIVEVDKCVLLCCRCHAEVHAGLYPDRVALWNGQVAQSGRAVD